MTASKVQENRLRRWADRLGLALKKSRAKMLHINDRGEYRIVDPYKNRIVAGERFDMGLDEVESFLREYEERLKRGE